jgi:hypothetical protein
MKAVVEIDTRYDYEGRHSDMLIRWYGQDGQQYGYRMAIPPGGEPVFMQEPPKPPAPKPVVQKAVEPEKPQDFLKESDRVWIDLMLTCTRTS